VGLAEPPCFVERPQLNMTIVTSRRPRLVSCIARTLGRKLELNTVRYDHRRQNGALARSHHCAVRLANVPGFSCVVRAERAPRQLQTEVMQFAMVVIRSQTRERGTAVGATPTGARPVA
jgi:hypothetical protein